MNQWFGESDRIQPAGAEEWCRDSRGGEGVGFSGISGFKNGTLKLWLLNDDKQINSDKP